MIKLHLIQPLRLFGVLSLCALSNTACVALLYGSRLQATAAIAEDDEADADGGG